MTRSRACPHPASRPEHPGQRNHPAASRRSTTPATTPTVTIGASAHPARPSRPLGQEKDGRAAANPDLITVASHTKKDNPAGLPSRPSSPQTTLTRRYVLIPKVAGHEALSFADGGERPSISLPSWRRGEAGGSLSAPRGADVSDGGARPPFPCRRSGGVKLEEV